MKFDATDPFFLRMSAMLSFTPTPTQVRAMQGLSMLMNSTKTKPVLIINGFAGTGKTTLMKAFCDAAESFNVNVILMSPTGRAAKVLANYTGRPASTIHRTIYRQETNSPDSSFEPSYNKWSNSVFVVDEASMIGDEYVNISGGAMPQWRDGRLLSDLIEFVFSQARTRLVLVGDPDQLPPVGVDSAPALDVDHLKSLGLTVGRVTLSDVVRQKNDSLILANAMKLREIIDGDDTQLCSEDDLPTILVQEGGDVEFAPGDVLLEKIENAFSKYGPNDVVVITRSNKRATQYSMALRSQALYIEDLLVKGDLLIVTRNNYLWSSRADTSFIANGDIAEVVSIYGYSEMHGLHFADVSLRFIDRNNIDIDCKIILDYLTADINTIDRETNIPTCTSTDQINKMLEKGAEADYADYTNQRKRASDMREDEWLNALQVRYAYSLTCHKSQGGQWSAVFVDPGFIPQDQSVKSFSKWLYTAISRAKHKLYIVNYPKVSQASF